ncbi:hypothetical protein BURMUCF1_2073 [Burkholderia multivorans ATCC BAA-247]|nr:hypothetical protein BURMUCF1_2073 [Burkholderia multivorans ATCC BAA-247]
MQPDAAHGNEIGNGTRGIHCGRQKKNDRSIIAIAEAGTRRGTAFRARVEALL